MSVMAQTGLIVPATTKFELRSGNSAVLEPKRQAWGKQLCWSHVHAQVMSCLQVFFFLNWKLVYSF